MMLSACGQIFEDVNTPHANAPYELGLQVSVQTSKDTNSRAGDHNDDSEQKGTAAENYIDFGASNFRLEIFNIDGTHLLDIDPDSWEVSTREDNLYVYHDLNIKLEFPKETDSETINRIRREGVKVMALANWNASPAQNRYNNVFVKADRSRQSLDEIWADNTTYNFDYTPTTGAATLQTWLPSTVGNAKTLIPMFGIGQSSPFTLNGNEYRTAVSVPMQRALAKVEVISKIDAVNGGIDNVTMSAYNNTARFIPDLTTNPHWDVIGAQVGVSSLPLNVQTQSQQLAFVKEGDTKWVAYIPEMYLGNQLNDARPHVNVTLTGNDTRAVHFALYDEDSNPSLPDDSWHHVLRNHIYRYEVSRAAIGANIHLHVIPWTRDDDEEWDYTDHVSVKTIEWSDYESMNPQTGEIFLSFDKPLQGGFQIMSPINGNWFVRLVPLNDAKPGAISFVDGDGKVLTPTVGNPPYCPELSGRIPGPVASLIRILPTNSGEDQESRFRIEFYVENLGNWVEVPMVSTSNSYTNYTIVRTANRIQ